MDYDKLIENLKTYKIREEQPLVWEKAVFAIKTLRAESNKLRAELERVKAERDAAVSDLETIMAYNSDTCQFCKNGQCYVRGGTKSCLPKWRGQKEE